MSNPQTFYTINNNGTIQDLSAIFQPISLGTPYTLSTGFRMSNGQDLNTIFAKYVSGNKATSTNYYVNGQDLNAIFAP